MKSTCKNYLKGPLNPYRQGVKTVIANITTYITRLLGTGQKQGQEKPLPVQVFELLYSKSHKPLTLSELTRGLDLDQHQEGLVRCTIAELKRIGAIVVHGTGEQTAFQYVDTVPSYRCCEAVMNVMKSSCPQGNCHHPPITPEAKLYK
jgi:hypothetical protein